MTLHNSHTQQDPIPADVPAVALILLAMHQLYGTVPDDEQLRIGAVALQKDSDDVLGVDCQTMPINAAEWEYLSPQRFAVYLNTMIVAGTATCRDLFVRQLAGPVLAWWAAATVDDGQKRVVATDLDGRWYHALPNPDGPFPVVGVHPTSAPTGVEPIVAVLTELRAPHSLTPRTPTALAASDSRMCGCWHPYVEHGLDQPHRCGVDGCDCAGFWGIEDPTMPGRWVLDTELSLAVSGVAGTCDTAEHHTGPSGVRWHWAPEFLTHHANQFRV
ncbi:hypothetical protein [Actinocatenispora rupis]|uniref:Uncharacterized protein n=1 Tax=Actinocatenispora rupis TaxID=519421 RepID=A0A8J3NB32_9ACTN|nr:hypothetical protein [Actinocatenispora rupis]GID10207.1 hypothetical protein Aru02nite_10960 [Actinocatenispora rupis]